MAALDTVPAQPEAPQDLTEKTARELWVNTAALVFEQNRLCTSAIDVAWPFAQVLLSRPAAQPEATSALMQKLERIAEHSGISCEELELIRTGLCAAQPEVPQAEAATTKGIALDLQRDGYEIRTLYAAPQPDPRPAREGWTDESMNRGDWRSALMALEQAQRTLEVDGARHSWLDGAIGVARSRSAAPAPGATIPREPSNAMLEAACRDDCGWGPATRIMYSGAWKRMYDAAALAAPPPSDGESLQLCSELVPRAPSERRPT